MKLSVILFTLAMAGGLIAIVGGLYEAVESFYKGDYLTGAAILAIIGPATILLIFKAVDKWTQ